MNTLASTTPNQFQTETGASGPFVPAHTLIFDTMKHGAPPGYPLSEVGTEEASTRFFQANWSKSYSGPRPLTLESLAKCWVSVGKPIVWSTAVQPRITILPAWRPQIDAVAQHEQIIAVLRLFGLDAVADRLGYLHSLADDDPEEPRIDIESLRAMALFIMGERQLPDPQIGVNPDGLIQIEWRVSIDGLLAMEFLPSGLIRFAAISARAQPGLERLRVNGTLPKEDTLKALRPFTSLL